MEISEQEIPTYYMWRMLWNLIVEKIVTLKYM